MTENVHTYDQYVKKCEYAKYLATLLSEAGQGGVGTAPAPALGSAPTWGAGNRPWGCCCAVVEFPPPHGSTGGAHVSLPPFLLPSSSFLLLSSSLPLGEAGMGRCGRGRPRARVGADSDCGVALACS